MNSSLFLRSLESSFELYHQLSQVSILQSVVMKVTKSFRLFDIPWTLQSMEFSRPEYWSGQTFPSPNPGIEARSPALQMDSLPAEPQGKPNSHQIINTFQLPQTSSLNKFLLTRICLQCRRPGFHSWIRKIPWIREWLLAPIPFAWRIPWTEEPGGLQPMGSQSWTQLRN